MHQEKELRFCLSGQTLADRYLQRLHGHTHPYFPYQIQLMSRGLKRACLVWIHQFRTEC